MPIIMPGSWVECINIACTAQRRHPCRFKVAWVGMRKLLPADSGHFCIILGDDQGFAHEISHCDYASPPVEAAPAPMPGPFAPIPIPEGSIIYPSPEKTLGEKEKTECQPQSNESLQ